jgi:hypothetical protein
MHQTKEDESARPFIGLCVPFLTTDKGKVLRVLN